MGHGNRYALRTLPKAAAQWAVRARLPLIIALAGALAGGGLYLGNRAFVEEFTPTSCPAGCVTNGNLSVSSDPVMQGWENKIAAANASATAGAYYSVVLLDPFIYSTSGTVSQSRMEDELKGAYLALAAANATFARNHTGAAIQLLLANEGTSAEEGESEAVQQIENLQGPDRIVAVAGMGLSTLNTETAATALSQVSMPMFGAVTTGDQLNGLNYRGFFQIVPNVEAQVHALVSSLHLTGSQPIALISSDQKTDIYSSNLNSDFMTALGYPPPPPLGEFSYDPATAEQQFAGYATTICTSRKSKYGDTASSTPLTVLYAGRATNLPALVAQFQQASICANLTVTIVTGSDANALPASTTTNEPDLPGAKVIVVYSDIESVAQLSQNAKLDTDFVTGTLQPGSCLNQEYDPWEVATYNSVMAATSTLSKELSAAHSRTARPTASPTISPTASPTEPPAVAVLSTAVDMTGSAPYVVPNGSFGFSLNGELKSPEIPVYTNKNGACS